MTAVQQRVYAAVQMMGGMLTEKLPEAHAAIKQAPFWLQMLFLPLLKAVPRLMPWLAEQFHSQLVKMPDKQIHESVSTIIQALSSILDEPEAATDSPATEVVEASHGSPSADSTEASAA